MTVMGANFVSVIGATAAFMAATETSSVFVLTQ